MPLPESNIWSKSEDDNLTTSILFLLLVRCSMTWSIFKEAWGLVCFHQVVLIYFLLLVFWFVFSWGKMEAKCSWQYTGPGSSNLHLWRQKSNCSSHIVTQFMDVLFGVILPELYYRKLIVSYSGTLKRLINVPKYTSSSGIWDERNWPYQCGVPQKCLQLDEQSNNFPQQFWYCHCQ